MCTSGTLNCYLLNKNLKFPLYFILLARYAFFLQKHRDNKKSALSHFNIAVKKVYIAFDCK